ncbi:MAG: PHP domain-containing protein [Tindallia sp. MSAO_Bac2]|nr:MAG: PHP domain-containing protein [Tindallia sp. MSAO_Bac2]
MHSYAVDLHIHTALSPCGEEEMTPNNIVNMAAIKGLDIIAVTDHNAIGNVQPCIEAGKKLNMVVVPGIEITTQEEVHLLAYFDSYQLLEEFYCTLKSNQMGLRNRPEIFGKQLLFDSKDVIIGEEELLLMNALQISFDDTVRLIHQFGGAAVPAHINRSSFSVMSSLGFLPTHLPIGCVELFNGTEKELFLSRHPEYKKYRHIISSDAHCLANIMERIFFVELSSLTASSLIQWLKI